MDGVMMATRILVHIRRIKACSLARIPDDDLETVRREMTTGLKRRILAAVCYMTFGLSPIVAVAFSVTGTRGSNGNGASALRVPGRAD